jgi:N-methylhydantoinase B
MPAMINSPLDIDAITLEMAWSRVISLLDEASNFMLRTSFSSVVREAKDFTVVLMDRHGRVVAHPTAGCPPFNGTMPRTIQHLLETFPIKQWHPGDFVVTNDPWMGTGHLNDVSAARPIFRGPALLGFAGVVAHMADIGGVMWSATSREIFEEGLQIPRMKLFARGEPNTTAFEFIRQNVRKPDIVEGDLYAMLAAVTVVDRRLNEFLDAFGADRWERLADEMISRAGAAMRNAIRAIPNGTYENEIFLDGTDKPLPIRVKVDVKHDSIHVDYAGSADQVPYAINSPYCYTYAYTVYPLKCLCSPATPNNQGTFDAITVSAPVGSILNPTYPAPTSARMLSGHPLHAAIFGALADAIPDRVIADSSAPRPIVLVSGYRDDGVRFHMPFFLMGGLGASQHGDGPACLPYPTNVRSTPVELMESEAAILVEYKELVPDSGGVGMHRGGSAQEIKIRNRSSHPMYVSLITERTHTAPKGLFGGGDGLAPKFEMEDGTPINPKGIRVVGSGEAFVVRAHGGGGYGDPKMRSRELIERDLINGYASREPTMPPRSLAARRSRARSS